MEERKEYNVERLYMFLQGVKAEKFANMVQRCKARTGLSAYSYEQNIYSNEEFCLTEHYCLGDRFSGQDVVEFQERSIWILNYVGLTREEVDADVILELLKMVVMALYRKEEKRGWMSYEKNGFFYLLNSYQKCGMHNGEGRIFRNEREVYRYTYYGGIVSD